MYIRVLIGATLLVACAGDPSPEAMAEPETEAAPASEGAFDSRQTTGESQDPTPAAENAAPESPPSAGPAAAPTAAPMEPTPTPERSVEAAPMPSEETPAAMPPADEECTYYDVRARRDGTEEPYEISAGFGDGYVCFAFDFGFDAKTQGLSFRPIVDNKKIVHHFMLYSWDGLDRTGTIDCESANGQGLVLGGWSPGSGDWQFPADVGIELGRGRFVLEVHYANFSDEAATDRSGMQICATQNLRPNTASVSWLGNQLFAVPPHVTDHAVHGRCTPATDQPVHILRTWPHMHQLGKRMTMRVERADGTSLDVFDEPFSHSDQKQYDLPLVLNPGDSLLTTCYYDNPNDHTVVVGERTADEMCHNFMIAYPAGALSTPSRYPNTCLGLALQ